MPPTDPTQQSPEVHLADGAGTEAAYLAILAAVLGQVVVQALDLQSGEGAHRDGAEVGAHVMGEQLAVAADGSQPEGFAGLQMGEPVVQQIVERRRFRPTNASARIAWFVCTVAVRIVALPPERLVERRSCRGPGGVAAQVVKPAPAVAVGSGALDAGIPAHTPRRAPALGLLVAFHAFAFNGAAGHRSSFP
jgi:hypothetical protein